MKISIGTDIIEISRVKDAIENIGNKFIEEIYTEKEILKRSWRNAFKRKHCC